VPPGSKTSRRKLAAILFADVTGYSHMMGLDEKGTVENVRRILAFFVRPTVKEGSGRVVKTMGDGVLATFDSAVHAVECAAALQKGFAEHNRALPADGHLRFRIGINIGDIVHDDNDVFGDGVNVAARIQALAEPGGILVTQSVVQQTRGKVPFAFEDLGERTLKNIAEPVRIFRAAIERAPAQAAPPASQPFAPTTPVVAVLPFANMSDDAGQQYFGDGIAEDIITELSRFRTLSVIARTSSFVYRDRAVDVSQIGRELGAQFLVEGSVRKLADRARITVQLVNADSRRHVWADKYDVQLPEIFSVQDDVTRRVVGTLVPRIETEQLEIAHKRPTEHMRAYDCYLKGKAKLYAANDADGRAEARNHFEEAIRLDPAFAAPYNYLCRIDNNTAKFSLAGAPVEELRERAWQFAQKSAVLDDSDPHTHIALAWCHLWRGEFDSARRHLDRATQLNPNDADRAMDRGTTLVYLGEPDAALETMQAGMRLNPFHPDAYRADFAEALFVARRYEEMLKIAEQIPDRTPLFPAWKAAAYAYLGRPQEARRQQERFVANMKAIWSGRSEPAARDYVAWLLSLNPFRRQEDIEHLAGGLKLAGLDTTGVRTTPGPGPR
jgi:TolB-like protein